jgi:methyl-accepting chemotaxis protein
LPIFALLLFSTELNSEADKIIDNTLNQELSFIKNVIDTGDFNEQQIRALITNSPSLQIGSAPGSVSILDGQLNIQASH